MHTVEQFLTQPSASEVEVAIGKLKRHGSPGVDQIPAEMIQTGQEALLSEIHKRINSGEKNCLSKGKSQLL
jgi:hypothetical protein